MKRGIWNWLFLISSFGLGLFFLVLLWQEMFPEWRGYQVEYYRRLAQVTGDRQKAATPLKILQYYLPELQRVDRCITCHTGIDNPKMKNQPQPFRTHPDFGNPAFLTAHPFTEMGCTVCHQGQGPATIKKHAHGPVEHWEKPLLKKEFIVGTCATCHEGTSQLKGAERLRQAERLFQEKGCIGCHTLHGKGMLIGPELAEAWTKSTDQFDFKYIQGEKTVPNWIYEHFKNPQKVTPGYPAIGIPESPMPNYELTDEETIALTALVLKFASEEGEEEHPIPARLKVRAEAAPVQPVSYSSSIEKGKALFQNFGCVACHGVDGRGGMRNKNMEPSDEVPPLTYVADGYTKEEMKQVIRNGRYPARSQSSGMDPPLWMPSWKDKISDEEIDAIIDYLVSLRPEGKN